MTGLTEAHVALVGHPLALALVYSILALDYHISCAGWATEHVSMCIHRMCIKSVCRMLHSGQLATKHTGEVGIEAQTAKRRQLQLEGPCKHTYGRMPRGLSACSPSHC